MTLTNEAMPIPNILESKALASFPLLIDDEKQLLIEASELFYSQHFKYSILGLWNAAVINLKRRVEAYGVDLWISVIQNEPGRKKYDKDGDSVAGRWEGVDDIVLISGATKLGLLNKKAGKALEMINWVRNHASAAHNTENEVIASDVIALALLLQDNLFRVPLPDPGHSVSNLFDPIKSTPLNPNHLRLVKDEIIALRNQDVRICFGFILDLLCAEEEPGATNASNLFPDVWARTNEDLRKTAGIKYHTLQFESDPALHQKNRAARNRLLNSLIQVGGVKFIPDAARAALYRLAAKNLGDAKNTSWGWRDEEIAAKTLAQLGSHVPSVAFEEVYQEVLSVWCGNFWGRSDCFEILNDFIEPLNTDQIREVSRMFRENERIKSELFQDTPKKHAIALLGVLEKKLTIESHKEEVRRTIESIKELVR